MQSQYTYLAISLHFWSWFQLSFRLSFGSAMFIRSVSVTA
ncbi:protein of unknown function [Chryseobacterium sp. JV274]|nr:protein of unknown function [Chryseobacterium sp. JV274]